MNIYVDLTRAFNAAGSNAILSSGQAVVFHRLAVMSKDGDWILRETQEALDRVLAVLEQRGAAYRFGAPAGPPLDARRLKRALGVPSGCLARFAPISSRARRV